MDSLPFQACLLRANKKGSKSRQLRICRIRQGVFIRNVRSVHSILKIKVSLTQNMHSEARTHPYEDCERKGHSDP